MHLPTFRGTVSTDGRLMLEPSEAARRTAYLQRLAGKPVTVTIAQAKTKRSLDQNAWLWGVALPTIAEAAGYDAHEHDDLHYDLLSLRFGTKAQVPKIVGASPRIVPSRTSSELSTAEFSDYMEWLVRWAAQTFPGLVVPLPNEVV